MEILSQLVDFTHYIYIYQPLMLSYSSLWKWPAKYFCYISQNRTRWVGQGRYGGTACYGWCNTSWKPVMNISGANYSEPTVQASLHLSPQTGHGLHHSYWGPLTRPECYTSQKGTQWRHDHCHSRQGFLVAILAPLQRGAVTTLFLALQWGIKTFSPAFKTV